MTRQARSYWPTIAGVLVLLAIAGAAQRWVQAGRTEALSRVRPLSVPLTTLSPRLGPFRFAQDHDIPPDIMRVAQVDSFLHREYREEGSNRPIVLYVGYWGRPNVGLGHGPEVCYPANGWVSEGPPHERELQIPGLGGDLRNAKVAMHHFTRIEPEGVQRVVVAFLAAVEGRFQPSSRGTFMHGPPKDSDSAFVAHIEAMTHVSGTSWDAADEAAFAFLEKALPEISAALFKAPA